MALNPFFLQGSITEQGLIQDLINEQLKIYGVDVYYIPREYVNEKTIIKEVIQSDFKNAFPIEAYVDTYEGYSGAGTILSKFGVQELDDVNLIISQERYETYLKPLIDNLPNVKLSSRPKEGDLIYFPLGDRLFEIKYVEHEKPFYQLKKNYVYELRCELFRYNNEVIDTEIEFIDDNVENEGYTQTLTLVGLGSLPNAYTSLINGGVRYITLNNRGKGYKSTPIVAISSSPEIYGTASGIATMIGGLSDLCEPNASLLRIQGVELKNTGYGYTVAPSVQFIGGKGTGASATAVIGNGVVGIITITNGGYGYVDPPTVTFSAPGAASTATAVMTGNINNSGFVTSITVANQQGFFDGSKSFNFPAPILTNALISPTINSNASIVSLNITNPGAGYTTTAINTIKFTGGGLTTSTYKFGSSSNHLNGNNPDIICSSIGSDIFRNGRVDFFIKLSNTSQPGELLISKGLYNTREWAIKLNANLKIELEILGGLDIFEAPNTINDGQWHFVSLQKTQNPYTSFNTILVVDGNVYELSSSEPNLYVASEGILIKNSINTNCYIDEFRIENNCPNYDSVVPTSEFTQSGNTIFLHKFEHATAVPVISDGKLTNTTITYYGSGYSSNPTVIVSPPTRLITAVGKPVISNSGEIVSVTIVNPGFGYSTSPVVSVATTSTLKQTALGRAKINSAGIVTEVVLTNAGVGYTQPPTISFSSPPISGIGTYIYNETIVGSASSATGRVKSWDGVTRQIIISNITGTFYKNEDLIGQKSGAIYKIKGINTDNLQDPYAQNDEIQQEADGIIDFSEKNPFGVV